MKSIKVNALASLMVNVLNIVFPLITNPYLTRILSKSNYSYFNTANTWASFVIPLAAFGIYNYGIFKTILYISSYLNCDNCSIFYIYQRRYIWYWKSKNLILYTWNSSLIPIFKYWMDEWSIRKLHVYSI